MVKFKPGLSPFIDQSKISEQDDIDIDVVGSGQWTWDWIFEICPSLFARGMFMFTLAAIFFSREAGKLFRVNA